MFFAARERSVESQCRAGKAGGRSQRTTLILIVQIGQINKFGKDLPGTGGFEPHLARMGFFRRHEDGGVARARWELPILVGPKLRHRLHKRQW